MDRLASSSDSVSINRRAFLGGGAAALVVPFTVSFSARAQAAGSTLGAYLKIDSTNVVTVYVGSTEMGQGIMTGLAQLVAEELMLSWSQVRGEQALGAIILFLVGRRRSVRRHYPSGSPVPPLTTPTPPRPMEALMVAFVLGVIDEQFRRRPRR